VWSVAKVFELFKFGSLFFSLANFDIVGHSEGENQGQLKFVFARKNVCLPRPKTVVIGKKSIWVTNKMKLQ
jgi:hypothetical protein